MTMLAPRLVLGATLLAAAAQAEPKMAIPYARALELAHRSAPELNVARSGEAVAAADVGVATEYPNPTISVSTSSQTARLSGEVSVPLVVFGQRTAARRAGQADLATAKSETASAWVDVRAQAAHAFVALWLAQKTAAARRDTAMLVARLDQAVGVRVAAGTAPRLEQLRAHSERLRAEADAEEAERLVAAAAADLGALVGVRDASNLEVAGDPPVPAAEPLGALVRRVGQNPALERERAAQRAAAAHARAERAAAWPALLLNLGFDAYDPTLPATDYRAGLGFELPVFNQRGAYVERERAAAAVAQARAAAARVRLTSELVAAYRRFEALEARVSALDATVVPAAEAAASAIEDAYTFGQAALTAVLDAEQSRISARLDLLDARAGRANAWIDVEHAVGVTR